MTDLLAKENLTTFVTWAAILITPVLTYFGIQVDQGVLIAGLSAIVTLLIAVYSSKHPNTLEVFDNDVPTVQVAVDTEQVQETINELVEKYNANNTIDVEVEDDDI